LTDLQHHELERTKSSEDTPESGYESGKGPSPYEDHRRVDFHWMVRDKNNLLWFSDLLNEVSRANQLDRSHLDIRIQTYVTQKRKQISEHVFRWLLEKHRTDEHPQSPITGGCLFLWTSCYRSADCRSMLADECEGTKRRKED
jgi:dual oxidase